MSEIEQVNIKTEYDLDHDVKVEQVDENQENNETCIISVDIKEERVEGLEDETEDIFHSKEKKGNIEEDVIGQSHSRQSGFLNETKGEVPGYFPCHICGAVFEYIFQVTRHLNEHVRRTFPCPQCTCTFNFESDLDTHILIHSDPIQLLNCDVCGEKFASEELLQLHRDEHKDDDGEGFPCTVCNLKLKTKYSLKIHMSAKHLSIQPFSCEECGKQFPAQWRLKEHMKLHTGDSLPCTYCDKQFISQSKLDMHLMSHTGEKPHECKVCYKRFSRESNLKVHMRLHTGQKNFRCELCQKAFYTNSDLTAHRKVHDKNKPKPFQCPDCESTFALKTQLKNHFINIHSTETPFSCEACDIKFKSKKTWKYHTMMQHSDEKPHKCSVCEKGFLIRHLLEKHMRTHTGERPYKCQFCDKCFKSRSNLNTHMGYMHKDSKKSKAKGKGTGTVNS